MNADEKCGGQPSRIKYSGVVCDGFRVIFIAGSGAKGRDDHLLARGRVGARNGSDAAAGQHVEAR
jgi:hypothetical protein